MKRLLIIATGSNTGANEVFQVLETLPVDVTLCHHGGSTRAPKNAHRRLGQQADRLGVTLHREENLPELLTASPAPDRILILMSPEEIATHAIPLMEIVKAHAAPHPRIMLSNPPCVTSLVNTLQLVAHAENFGIDLWLQATKRYAAGVQHLYGNAATLAPLTHITASTLTGVYTGTGRLSELMRLIWQETDLLSSLAARTQPASDFPGTPQTVTAEHTSLYRDSLSAAFSFNDGTLAACLSLTTGDAGNLGFRERICVVGVGGTLSLNETLNEFDYINLNTDAAPIITADEFMHFVKREILRTEETTLSETTGTEAIEENQTRLKRMLHDFLETASSPYSPTLRSCVPGIWTANAILRSLDSKGRIDRRGEHDMNPERFHVECIEKLALGGNFETAINRLKSRISQPKSSLSITPAPI